jgi:hypothetical protein
MSTWHISLFCQYLVPHQDSTAQLPAAVSRVFQHSGIPTTLQGKRSFGLPFTFRLFTPSSFSHLPLFDLNVVEAMLPFCSCRIHIPP